MDGTQCSGSVGQLRTLCADTSQSTIMLPPRPQTSYRPFAKSSRQRVLDAKVLGTSVVDLPGNTVLAEWTKYSGIEWIQTLKQIFAYFYFLQGQKSSAI